MTPRERLLTALRHQEPDRVPIHFTGGDALLRRMIEAADLPDDARSRFLRGDVDTVTFRSTAGDRAFAPYHRATPPGAEIDEWGVGTLRHPESGTELLTMHIFHPLADVRSPEELEDYPWPDVTARDRWEHIDAAVEASHAAGRPAIGQMSQTLVERAYMLRPPPQLFVDLYENPEFVRRLFDEITERQCFRARTFARAGVDVLRIGDDLATQRGLMVSVRTYRDWIKPYHEAVVRAALDLRPDLHVLYHSDGNIEALIPELLDIGVTAVNPVQPECIDPSMVKQRWGDRLTIWGAAGTQRTLAFGTDADVDAEVEDRVRRLSPGGAYVLNFINVAWSPSARRNVLRYLTRMHERGTC